MRIVIDYFVFEFLFGLEFFLYFFYELVGFYSEILSFV